MLSGLLLLGFASFPWVWAAQVCRCHCTCLAEQAKAALRVSSQQSRQMRQQRPPPGQRHRLRGSRSRSEEFAPEIIDHPSDLVLRRDQPATLNCRATGNPTPVIEWYRNGEYVKTNKDDPASQPSLLPDGSLFFFRLSQKKGKSDEGVYTCVARNNLGVATSKNASLYVEALQEEFRLHPSNAAVSEGERLLLECLPPRGHPEPSTSWKKNGTPLNEENGHYQIFSTKLLVTHALKSDSGAYVCIATNQAGERTSRVALVSVLEKPKFARRPNDVVARLGSNVQFLCGVYGDPAPTVWWHKENGELPPGRYEVNQENTLQIHHLTAHDAGKYVCTARNQADTIAAKASLVVQDPLDTGQKGKDYLEDAHQELMDVQVFLMNATAVPSAMAAYLHWKVVPSSKHLEGYTVFYRSLLPVNTSWAEWNVTKDHHAIVPRLKRGYKYEFKVQPCMEKICGLESNRRQLWIPEEVPSAAPERVSLTTFQDGNGTAIIHWEPPPQTFHNGLINGYQVWFLRNGTHHGPNRTVDGKTHHLEVTGLPSGLKYCVQVAAINGAGVGLASNPVCSAVEPSVDKMAKSDDFASGGFVLDLLRQPIFIASLGSALWIMLMVLAVYVCQQQARQYRREGHYTFGEGLYRNASDDTIIKHRIDSSGSPWLSNTWKSSDSKTYSTNSSLGSQCLWADSKDSQETHKPAMLFERQSQGSHVKTVPLMPDSRSSSLYGAFRADLPVKDPKTFSSPAGSHPSSPSLRAGEVAQSGDQRTLPCYSQNAAMPTASARRGARTGLRKAANPVPPPHVMIQESWDKTLKKELQQMHSSPVPPSSFSVGKSNHGSQASNISLGKHPRTPGVTKKVLKTYSTPRFSHWGASQNMDGLLPPPPPLPPGFQAPRDHGVPKECTCTCYLNPPPVDPLFQQQDKEPLPAASESVDENQTSPGLPYGHLSAVSVSGSFNDDTETVLTPEEVAEYLELSEEAECQRQQHDSTPAPSQVFSLPHTYGYISGPLGSELLENDAMDEDEDDEEEEDVDGHSDMVEACCSSSRFFRRFCRTPPSSLSEDDTSLAGSLLNGWGSVSEDNGTSTRCSLVSSSDGSFFVDANFAQALAVAVDSFCFGLSQRDLDQVLAGASVSDFMEPPDGTIGAVRAPFPAPQDFGSGAFAVPTRGEKSVTEKLVMQDKELEETVAEKSRWKI